jgi:hypothetical protein
MFALHDPRLPFDRRESQIDTSITSGLKAFDMAVKFFLK